MPQSTWRSACSPWPPHTSWCWLSRCPGHPLNPEQPYLPPHEPQNGQHCAKHCRVCKGPAERPLPRARYPSKPLSNPSPYPGASCLCRTLAHSWTPRGFLAAAPPLLPLCLQFLKTRQEVDTFVGDRLQQAGILRSCGRERCDWCSSVPTLSGFRTIASCPC